MVEFHKQNDLKNLLIAGKYSICPSYPVKKGRLQLVVLNRFRKIKKLIENIPAKNKGSHLKKGFRL